MFLTEKQAKANIKELIAYDALQLISAKQEQRITNFQSTISTYISVVEKKDGIIAYKDSIISVQEKIIKYQKPFEFHSYAGARTYNLEIANPIFYYRAQVEFKSLNVGGQVNFQPVVPNSSVDGFYYNIYVEFKIF